MSEESSAVAPPRSVCRGLDFARGVCVLAMLLPTLPWLCRPFQVFAVHLEPGGTWDRHILAVLLFFCDHKILPLFAVIFGMGLAIQLDRLGDQTKPYFKMYFLRMVILFLFGVVNALLFWWGDLLTIYAVVGLHTIVFLLGRPLIERVSFYSCFLIFYGMLAVGCVLAGFWLKPNGAIDLDLPPSKITPEGVPVSLWFENRELGDRLIDYVEPNNQLRIYRGRSFLAVFEHRIFLHFLELLHDLLITAWYMIACALLGARLVRGHLLEPAGRPLAWRLILLGLLVGIPCQLAAVVLFYQHQPILSYLFNQLGDLPQSLLYLVVLLRIAQADWFATLQKMIRAVGRTALSNYLLQGLVACVLFHGYGFGWYGISLAEGLLVVLGIWVGELVLSPLWLAQFHAGPVEWLWRSLAERRLRPLLRRA